jgi:hypothetical protein
VLGQFPTFFVLIEGWPNRRPLSHLTRLGTVGNALVQHSGGGWTGMKGYCGTSIGVVACGKPWLSETKFDVIHFNWGLHDICASMYAPISRELYV